MVPYSGGEISGVGQLRAAKRSFKLNDVELIRLAFPLGGHSHLDSGALRIDIPIGLPTNDPASVQAASVELYQSKYAAESCGG